MQRTIKNALILTLVIIFGAAPVLAGAPGYTLSGCPISQDLTAVDGGGGSATWCPELYMSVSQVSLGIDCSSFGTPININLSWDHPDICEAADMAFRVMSGHLVRADSTGRIFTGSTGFLILDATSVSEFGQ